MSAPEPQSISVSEAVLALKRQLRERGTLKIRGEVNDYRGPHLPSGHCYFSIKDEAAQLKVVAYRSVFSALTFALDNGVEVAITGNFDLYDKRGELSFIARSIQLAGEGILRQKVEELMRRLGAEGLFATERKLPVPAFCQRVVVVTSPSGAVKEDVRRTLARRNPLVSLAFESALVQGQDAPATIIAALERAARAKPDVILLVRGGGSLEDLMAFNDEKLARAIAASSVPIVTGIGHEPDTTIADMVASKRASTPTAAAEMIAPDLAALESKTTERAVRMDRTVRALLDELSFVLDQAQGRMQVCIDRVLEGERARLATLEASSIFKGGLKTLFAMREQRLDHMQMSLHAGAAAALARSRHQVSTLENGFASAGRDLLAKPTVATNLLATRLQTQAPVLFLSQAKSLEAVARALEALSPERVLARGYAIVTTGDGHVVDSYTKAEPGQAISVQLADGTLGATVSEVMKTKPNGGGRDR